MLSATQKYQLPTRPSVEFTTPANKPKRVFSVTPNSFKVEIMEAGFVISDMEFPFKTVPLEAIQKIRLLYCKNNLHNTFFIRKENNEYKITKVPKKLSFYSSGLPHLCTNCACGCNECPKLIDLFAESADKDAEGFVYYHQIKRIEKYPFILKGIEVFNSRSGEQFLLVEECSKFKSMRLKKDFT